MNFNLTEVQQKLRKEFAAFAGEVFYGRGDEFDLQERIPEDVIGRLRSARLLGAAVQGPYGTRRLDMISYGLLTFELSRACSSVRSLLTVHDMVCHALAVRGRAEAVARWLPALARGERVAAFALSEPEAGSDAGQLKTTAEAIDGKLVLNGRKTWISFGQIADVFLVCAKQDEKTVAVLVERDSPGLAITPISGMAGLRGSMLAQLDFKDCEVGEANVVAIDRTGLASVASTALSLGRYSVAWGCVAIIHECLSASESYAAERIQFGKPIAEHQLVQEMLTNMHTSLRAGRLLCLQSGFLKDNGDPTEIAQTLCAKYFCSRAAVQAASDAVQIHGALGLSASSPVIRHYRDAKCMEIIEGSTQLLQAQIARVATFSDLP